MNNKKEEYVERAVCLFMKGHNCSQSVAAAFADVYNLDPTTVLRLSAGFGGGVGRMRMMCGAVSGMVMLAGMEEGPADGDNRQAKTECYKHVRQIVEKFKDENGSIICEELLKMNGCKAVKDSSIPDERTAKYYAERPCARKVASAARIYAEFLEERDKGEKEEK